MEQATLSRPRPRRRRGETDRDLNRRQEHDLLRRYARDRSPALKEELAERLLPLARSLAARYEPRTETHDDLFQVASVGLMKAIDGFDPSRGKEFTAFAVPTILGELRRHFRDHVWNLRLPRSLQERVMKLNATVPALSQKLGRTPTVEEISRRMGLTAEEVLEAMEADQARETRSADAPQMSVDETAPPLVETLGTTDPGYVRAESQIACRDCGLCERDLEILRLRFDEGMTQYEIGRRLGVSQMQISRISRRALWKLLNGVRGEVLGGGAAPPASRRRSGAGTA
jgi:RNA polymerase sigma-B factor